MEQKPFVYACSGCSNLGVIANNIAEQLDRDKIADMSCVLCLKGNEARIVDPDKLNSDVIVIDGCREACTKISLSKSGISPDYYIILESFGIEKSNKKDASMSESCVALKLTYSALVDMGIEF